MYFRQVIKALDLTYDEGMCTRHGKHGNDETAQQQGSDEVVARNGVGYGIALHSLSATFQFWVK